MFSQESNVYARDFSESGFREVGSDAGVPLLAHMIEESSCFSRT